MWHFHVCTQCILITSPHYPVCLPLLLIPFLFSTSLLSTFMGCLFICLFGLVYSMSSINVDYMCITGKSQPTLRIYRQLILLKRMVFSVVYPLLHCLCCNEWHSPFPTWARKEGPFWVYVFLSTQTDVKGKICQGLVESEMGRFYERVETVM